MELMVMGLLLGRPPRRPKRSPLGAPVSADATRQHRIDHHDHTHFTGQNLLRVELQPEALERPA